MPYSFVCNFGDNAICQYDCTAVDCTAEETNRYRPDKLERGISTQSLEAGDAVKVEPETSTWRAILELATPFFCELSTRYRAWALTAASVVFIVAETGIFLYYSEVNKNYMSALQEKNSDGFYNGLKTVMWIIVMFLPVLGLQQYFSRVFCIEWRCALTSHLAGRYYTNNMFYRMQLAGDVDNPDQRLCQDIGDFVSTTFEVAHSSASTICSTIGFIGVLYSISPGACLGVLAYAGLGTFISARGFAPWIMKYQFLCVKQEADMRYCLIRTRENAESIAFFGGGGSEHERFGVFFGSLVSSLYRRIYINACYAMFKQTFHFSTFAVPTLLVAPAYLRGDVEFGAISQANMAFNVVLGGLSLVMNQMTALSDLAVRVKRLRVLEEVLLREEERAEGLGRSCIELQDMQVLSKRSPILQLREMTLKTPPRAGAEQQTLVECLTLDVGHGESLLIVGDSGIGKSSLLRALAGLWNEGLGSILRPAQSRNFFLPQKPYMFLGTLREQLLYPDLDRDLLDISIQEALADVNLDYLLDKHDLSDTKDWANLLSGGEQQRINFARVLLRPGLLLAFVDEGTSACDTKNEARLYEVLKERVKSYVSVGHRPALRKYHTHVLWLQRPSQDDAGMGARHQVLTMHEYEEALAQQEDD